MANFIPILTQLIREQGNTAEVGGDLKCAELPVCIIITSLNSKWLLVKTCSGFVLQTEEQKVMMELRARDAEMIATRLLDDSEQR